MSKLSLRSYLASLLTSAIDIAYVLPYYKLTKLEELEIYVIFPLS